MLKTLQDWGDMYNQNCVKCERKNKRCWFRGQSKINVQVYDGLREDGKLYSRFVKKDGEITCLEKIATEILEKNDD